MTGAFFAPRSSSKWLGAAIAITALAALSTASAALGDHQRPGSGTPLRVPLVNAYDPCTSGFDRTHGPEGTLACEPSTDSVLLKTGNTGTSSGFVRLQVFCNNGANPPCNAAPGDQEDIEIEVFLNDVRCVSAGFSCGAADGDYTGQVMLRFPIRLTDHFNAPVNPTTPCTGTGDPPPPCQPGTPLDWSFFGLPITCNSVGAANTPPGSSCSLTTTIDSLTGPTKVTERQRAIYRIPGEIQVFDPGIDASVGGSCPTSCGSGDENVFMGQGLFAP